ncbi:MAG: NGG1p interacting factor NIF3 [Gammaproteobacteria bacterium]|nr:NGG1p interacting factor NIF3 [Gammaproteobacteria bacterium]MCW5583681.1 NGG1p interacting factor NIF3 [Gammaproteobacteria bacterium]
MYKICFYVPISHAEEVKNNMFAKGAGKIGNYTSCAWQVLGKGQFTPATNSNPFIGEQDKLEKIDEFKIEMICDDRYIHDVITALKKSHPYEEPAYQTWKIEDI